MTRGSTPNLSPFCPACGGMKDGFAVVCGACLAKARSGERLPPRRLNAFRRAQHAQLLGTIFSVVTLLLVAFIDVKVIVGLGPVICLCGLVGIVLAWRAVDILLIAANTAHVFVCLFLWLLIVATGWSPFEATVPVLFVAGVYCAVMTPISILIYRRHQRQGWPWECARCGYLLFGLTEPRCPECGLGFDPASIP